MKLRWGNVPLPEAHLAGVIVGAIVQCMVPKRLFPARWIGRLLGWPLILAGAGLATWAVAEAGEADISAPDELLTEGAYGVSRNPMYAGWTLIQAGIGVLSNGFWLFATLPAVVAYTHFAEIRREEESLERRFGDEYRNYKGRVPRYI